MDWKSTIQDILQRYSGQAGGAASAPADPHQDYQEVAQAAPAHVVAGGISQAFRSDQTPPFPQMLAKLFSNSDPNQRAGLLNQLLGTLGQGSVTPEQAAEYSPAKVQQMAANA